VEPWTNGPENTGLTALTQMVEVLGSDPRCCKFESCERYVDCSSMAELLVVSQAMRVRIPSVLPSRVAQRKSTWLRTTVSQVQLLSRGLDQSRMCVAWG
jgi:hypothetical protein